MKDILKVTSRGVGIGGGYPSLVTGEDVPHGPDLSIFVASRADAYTIADWIATDMFKDARTRRVDRCYVAYRDFEPGWLQVKFCAEPEHEEVLNRLHSALTLRDGLLDKRLLDWCVDPDNNRDIARGHEELLRVIETMVEKC